MRKRRSQEPSGGEYTMWTQENGLWVPRFTNPNLRPFSWGAIAVQTIAVGKAEYKVGGIYFEFENVATPDTEAAIPSFDQTALRSYYEGLSGSRDFIRARMITPPILEVRDGYEDSLEDGQFNQCVFTGQTNGTDGVHGLPFSSDINSKVVGIALIASPDWDDRSRDIVFARGYYSADQQILKMPSSEVQATWRQWFV